MTGLEFAALSVVEKEAGDLVFSEEAGSLIREIGGMNDAAKLPKEIGGVSDALKLPKEIRVESFEKNRHEVFYASKMEGKSGGSYKDIFVPGEGDRIEIHHMPPHDVTGLNFSDGPAIKMDKADHRQTASWGNSKEAREYRQKQKELIDAGKFEEALQMDIDDIHEKFGDKYDEGIAQLKEYVAQLKEAGKI